LRQVQVARLAAQSAQAVVRLEQAFRVQLQPAWVRLVVRRLEVLA
jgi:hypothetical protein